MTVADSRVVKERDLYRRLLDLRHERDLRKVLGDALEMAVEVTGAELGYLEVYGDDARRPEWSMSRGCSDAATAEIRNVTSKGIVAATIAAGQTIHTPAALIDERFANRGSVQDQRLEAVLCTPLGGPPPSGVLYLQGRRGAGPFSNDDVELAERLARDLAPTLESLAAIERTRGPDPTLPWRQKMSIPRLVGRSAAFATVLEDAYRVARLEVTVMITGASGTGKTELARAIHENSQRQGGPFQAVNCATISADRAEIELFGAYRGSYTDAREAVIGKVEAAQGGTLFLDEIAELPLGAQAKLLQVTQSREYFPLGASRAHLADVRIIAATNADLMARVRDRSFREDLYYRLTTLSIRMPSLAERREDIVAIARELASVASRTNRLPMLPFSAGACRALEGYEWPGNVRELANIVNRGLIRAAGEGAPHIEEQHVFPRNSLEMDVVPSQETFHQATRRFQKQLLSAALEAHGWSIKDVAKALDIDRSYVYVLINQFGIKKRGG